MALKLRLGPVANLRGKQSCLGSQRSVPGVAAWRRGELVLVERGRLVSRARLMALGLEEMGGGRGVRLRGRHTVDVVGIEARLVEQRSVELVALAGGRREEGEIAVVQVRRQEGSLRLGVEGQRRVGAGGRRRLTKRRGSVWVEGGGVGEVCLGERALLLRGGE